MSWEQELQQDIWEYDALSVYYANGPLAARKLFWIYHKWKLRFDQRDAFLQTQTEFPQEIAWEIASNIAPPGTVEHYFPRRAWDYDSR